MEEGALAGTRQSGFKAWLLWVTWLTPISLSISLSSVEVNSFPSPFTQKVKMLWPLPEFAFGLGSAAFDHAHSSHVLPRDEGCSPPIHN